MAAVRAQAEISDEAAALLDAWAAHIDDLLDTQFDLMKGGHRWRPEPGSPLENIRSQLLRHFGPDGDWDGDEAESAGRLATLHLATAGQHLEGIRALLLARHVIGPIAPIARAIVEAAGRTFWLIDPRHTSVRDFAARLWMVRIEDITRRVRTAKGWGPEANHKALEDLVRSKKRLRTIEIPRRFYSSEVENDNGEITLRGQQVPGLSGSLKHIAAGMRLDEDFHTPMYAYLSDATHPTPYAAVETLQAVGEGEEGDLYRFGSADMRREYMIWQAAVHAYQQTWMLTTAYFGCDQQPVMEVCDRIKDVPKPFGDTAE